VGVARDITASVVDDDIPRHPPPSTLIRVIPGTPVYASRWSRVMPDPVSPVIDVRVLFHDGPDSDDLLWLASRPDQPGFVLPGGPVAAGEGVDGAFARHLEAWTGQAGLPRAFVGCVESGGGAEHELALIFAVRWSPPAAARRVAGAELSAISAHDLAAVSVRPDWLAPTLRRWVDEDWPFWRGVPVRGAEPAWGHLRQSVASLRAQLSARGGALDTVAFRDASVAMCALVAAADGRIDVTERDKMLAFVTSEPALAAFSPHELERLFDTHVDRLRVDPERGRAAALREIAKVRGRPVEARAVVQLGAVIGLADGSYDAVERQAVSEAIDVLGLDGSAVSVQGAP
jgi:tellurite resistance protein/ADP-ribose pyrophosphatase YjhB (NUDIX family)